MKNCHATDTTEVTIKRRSKSLQVRKKSLQQNAVATMQKQQRYRTMKNTFGFFYSILILRKFIEMGAPLRYFGNFVQVFLIVAFL